MPDLNKKLFLSAVSSEFLAYRELLAQDLKRPTLEVAVQEDIERVVTGGSTLEKLDDYIRVCHGVIHLVGKATGYVPEEPAIAALLAKYPDFAAKLKPLAPHLAKPQPGFSYTQWEAYLAIYHQRPLFVYRPTDFDLAVLNVPRAAKFVFSAAEEQSQKDHYARISALGHDRGQFLNEERLSSAVLRDLVEILPRLGGPISAEIAAIVKYAPSELIGRESETAILDDAWRKVRRAESPRPHILNFVALGGEGKTSLVAKWAADLAGQDWPGCDAVFAWSFYSQGAREQTAVSSDLFLAEALTFFGDEAMAKSAAGAFDKGRRLAQLVGERRALLILDGLEPLQYAPSSPTPGELKDQGLAALLKGLAATSKGLCVLTTRYALPDLRAFHDRTVREEKLTRLARAAGVQLLKAHGVTGSDRRNLPHTDAAGKKELLSEFEMLVEVVDGHALTLHLMGSFLKRAFQGDIRRRDRVTFAKANQQTDNGHAFRAMEAYEKWLANGSEEARRELALLSLMGLFDRPANADCLLALLQAPAIAGLNEPLVGLPEEDWNGSLTALQDARLLTVNRDAAGTLLSLDAHPLLREFFAVRVRKGTYCSAFFRKVRHFLFPRISDASPAWREAHRRLYERLCKSTKEGNQPTLEDLQPLYQAVAHGCQAGLQQDAHDEVHLRRIRRGGAEDYSVRKLGAFGSELGALACFFERPWSEPSPKLRERDQAILLTNAAFRLRAVGRMTEALEPMRAGLAMGVKQADWETCASSASNLSELELTLGEVAGAAGDAEQSVTYADRSGDAFQRMARRTTHADALHQAGRRVEAEARFREAEQMQADHDSDHPLLYSQRGFQYCDLLLTAAEREAWRKSQEAGIRGQESGSGSQGSGGRGLETGISGEETGGGGLGVEWISACRAVSERAARTLKWVTDAKLGHLDIALDHLTLGRAALYVAILNSPRSEFRVSRSELDSAVSGTRRAGVQEYLVRALLTRAWQRSLTGPRTGPERAQSDLDEAWEIAERGPMPLYMADIHLHRARLFFRETVYPWESPQHDLAEARRLIFKYGYLRRKEELEDAEAILNPPRDPAGQ